MNGVLTLELPSRRGLMSGDDEKGRCGMVSGDLYCPVRRMLAEELVRQRAADWTSETDEDRR